MAKILPFPEPHLVRMWRGTVPQCGLLPIASSRSYRVASRPCFFL